MPIFVGPFQCFVCPGHIKPEKLLSCPKCIFVTEYKHHLEYHLRNHYGKDTDKINIFKLYVYLHLFYC